MLYYYHWVDTSAGGLLFPEDIIRPVVNASALACCITSTGSIPLVVDYYSPEDNIRPVVNASALACVITITGSIPLLVDYQSPRTSSSSSQYFGTGMFYYYHWVDTSAGGQLVPEDIIRPVVNASALACCVTSTWSIPLLVDY